MDMVLRCVQAAASVLQQETDKWEDDTNSIVKVAKTISAQMYDMAKYARKINNPAVSCLILRYDTLKLSMFVLRAGEKRGISL